MKLDVFFKQAQLLQYKKGQIILRPDEESKDIFYIEKGYIRVYSLTEWGDEKLFVIYKPGEIFPLFWLFDHLPLLRFYEALDLVAIRKVSKDGFMKLLKFDQEALFELTNKIIATFDVIINRIDSLEFTNAYARLASRLLFLAERFGEKRGNKILISVPITHKDIASSIALTRETTSREFEKLEKKGIIKYVNNLILINDSAALKKEISAHYDKRLI